MAVTENIWSSNIRSSNIRSSNAAFRGVINDGNSFDASSPCILEVFLIASLCSRAKFNRSDVPISER
ncbi:hypothetical protein BGZ70_010076 [Mortierella alpina]|uniref:Uncharacterized protein n=1 Tax=Mortierella alpina TaxID=64518 RepID=A0A9P6J019_MORAP|nr:hypothetical protein BGZ70_010076 [Mortierella alpina]